MKKNLFFLYLFISIFMHHDIIQSYDPQCTFTPDLGGLYNNQQSKQSKFQSAFSPSSSYLKNVSPQVNPTLSYKASKEKKKVGLIAGLVQRIFGWGKSKKENTIVQQSPMYVSAQHVYYPSPLLINLTQEQPPQFLQQPSVTLPKTPEISTQVLRNLQKNNNIAYAANNRLNDQEFKNIMLKRGQALEKSVHPATTCLQSKRFHTQTAGFLQAHNIALQPFEQLNGLPIQHQLTAELFDVLDHLADYAMHADASYDTHLLAHCAHLASTTQESNMQGLLQQAIQGTNCCHGLDHYVQGMVAVVGQQYEKFQAAFHYFQPVLQEYALAIEQHAVESLAMLTGLEAMATVGLVAAPTATVAAGGMMLAATAYVMAPVCLQAAIDSLSFGAACIQGDWDKVAQDLDDFKIFATSPQTVGHIAGLTAGAVLPAPHLHLVMDHLLSLRPVITQVQQASGQAISKFYMMSKQQAAQVYEQSVELLQLPEFVNFNLNVQTILGSKFFTLIEQDQYALMPAFASGLENNLLTSADQVALTQLYNQSNASIVGDVLSSGASQVVSNVTRSIIEKNAHELSQLVPAIRQLQDLANFTRNFTNLADLIPQDILYLHRIYELQEYRAQIVNYLQEHKPYFIYEGQQYFIEDIASYHIHAGDYFRKDQPSGGHSNYGGNKLNHFNPIVNKEGFLGVKDVILHNARFMNKTKPSSIYPENWSEYFCDLKAIEIFNNPNTEIKLSKNGMSLQAI